MTQAPKTFDQLRALLASEAPDNSTLQDLERHLKQAELRKAEQEHDQRGIFSWVSIVMVAVWMDFCVLTIIWQGLTAPKDRLATEVLVALVVASLGNVIGLFAIVLQGLFGNSKSPES